MNELFFTEILDLLKLIKHKLARKRHPQRNVFEIYSSI